MPRHTVSDVIRAPRHDGTGLRLPVLPARPCCDGQVLAEASAQPGQWAYLGPTRATSIVACVPAYMDASGASISAGGSAGRGGSLGAAGEAWRKAGRFWEGGVALGLYNGLSERGPICRDEYTYSYRSAHLSVPGGRTAQR